MTIFEKKIFFLILLRITTNIAAHDSRITQKCHMNCYDVINDDFPEKKILIFFCFCSTTLTLFCPNRDKYAAEDQNVKRNIEFFTNSNSYLENKLKSLKVRLPCKSFERMVGRGGSRLPS